MNTKTKKLKSFKWIVCTLALIVFCVNMIQIPMQKISATESYGPSRNADGTVTITYKYDDGEELYICGSFTSWEFQKMSKGENNVFSYTTEVLSAGSYEYKFAPEAAWGRDFNQNGETGGAPNSTFIVKDLGVTLNGDGTATLRKDYDGDELYLVGSMNGWSEAIVMTKGTDGVFEVTIPVEEGMTYEYKYKVSSDMSDWEISFNQDGGNTNSTFKVPGKVQAYAPINNGDGTVTFTYANVSAKNVYVAGAFDKTVWQPTGLAMENNGEGLWSLTMEADELVNYEDGDLVQYKFVVDGTNWITDPSNEEIKDGNSVFVYHKFDKATCPILNANGTVVFSFDAPDATSVSVAGDMNGWDANATQLTKNAYGIWTCVFEPIPGTEAIIYKYVVNGSDWIVDPNRLDEVGDGFGGVNGLFNLIPQKVEHKKVVLKYIREDGDYEGWCLWNWSTGLKEGKVDFEVKDGVATAIFDVSDDCQSVGFKVMKDNWAQVDVDSDRYVTIDKTAQVTKVVVYSGMLDIMVVPTVKEYEINPGVIDFQYRNIEAYNKDEQDKITDVKVVLDTPQGTQEVIPMNYDSLYEYFVGSYINDDMQEGEYTYKFVYKYDGEDKETEAKSFEYIKRGIEVKASIDKNEISYDQNAIVSVEATGDISKEAIRDVYMDLSEIGGKEKTPMSKDLLISGEGKFRQTIAVTNNTTAGDKTISVVIVDDGGVKHEATCNLTVKTKVSSGDKLDFSFDEAIVYQVITDRFLNGNTENDDPNGKNYDKTAPYTYHGGDFAGIIKKIEDGYLTNLGVNTIWISPIVENTDISQGFAEDGGQYSYHGYWAKDFTVLDPHFGTMEEFKKLIDVAHQNGIKIMVDIVINHSGYGTEALFGDMLRSESGDDIFTTPSSGLPDFRTEDPVVRAKLIKWQVDWLEKAKTESGNTIDYFRVDTVKHVEDATWKELKSELTKANPEFKMIGEQYGADYNADGGQLQNGQMDAVLDFSYKNYAKSFVNGNLSTVSGILDERASKLNSSYLLGQFLSSHDENGFLYNIVKDRLGDALGNTVTKDDVIASDLAKQKLAASLQLTDKGMPVIYNGEELGQSAGNGMGCKDANRNDIEFSRMDDAEFKAVYDHYAKLINARKEFSKIFAQGNRDTIVADDETGITVYTRNYNNASVVVALNVKEVENELEVPVTFEPGTKVTDMYSGEEYTVTEDKIVKVTVPSALDGGTVILADKNNKGDEPQEPQNPQKPQKPQEGSGESEKTGDNALASIVLVSMLFVASGAFIVISKKKRVK